MVILEVKLFITKFTFISIISSSSQLFKAATYSTTDNASEPFPGV